MSILSGIGSVLGGVGSVASGLGLGGGEKRPSYRPYLKAMGLPKGSTLMDAKQAEIATDWQARMDAAKKHGIHPLHALGVNVQTTSPVAHVGGSSGPDLGAIAYGGSEIARGVLAGQSNMERLQERLLEAQIQGQEIDNVSRASMFARTYGMPGTAAGLPDRFGNVHYGPADRLGSSGKAPLHVISIDDSGRPMRVYNSQDLGDSEILSAAHAMTYGLTDFIHGRVGRPAGRWIAKQINRFR